MGARTRGGIRSVSSAASMGTWHASVALVPVVGLVVVVAGLVGLVGLVVVRTPMLMRVCAAGKLVIGRRTASSRFGRPQPITAPSLPTLPTLLMPSNRAQAGVSNAEGKVTGRGTAPPTAFSRSRSIRRACTRASAADRKVRGGLDGRALDRRLDSLPLSLCLSLSLSPSLSHAHTRFARSSGHWSKDCSLPWRDEPLDVMNVQKEVVVVAAGRPDGREATAAGKPEAGTANEAVDVEPIPKVVAADEQPVAGVAAGPGVAARAVATNDVAATNADATNADATNEDAKRRPRDDAIEMPPPKVKVARVTPAPSIDVSKLPLSMRGGGGWDVRKE